ncbi:hypothetical protein GHT06_016968 [Daphnia sinensis]|uniref:PH domain-containing protein n=1 Tax=Daphnia sinensis TaxID=1820382 RepID=A0AAD5PRI6_9CRUS|nr:hypothetical protein GHT06_016968 [Daphnia sinensis]
MTSRLNNRLSTYVASHCHFLNISPATVRTSKLEWNKLKHSLGAAVDSFKLSLQVSTELNSFLYVYTPNKMDLFTENMIKRTKQRQEQLHKAKPNFGFDENPTKEPLGDPKNVQLLAPEKKENFSGKENNTGLKSTQNSPLKIQASAELTPPLQMSRKTRLEVLAHRVKDWEDQSGVVPKPLSSTPEKNLKGASTPLKFRDQTTSKSRSANSIANATMPFPNDKLDGGFSSKEIACPPCSMQPEENTPVKLSASEESSTPYKSLVLDKSVLQSLESQGFTPTESRSRLIYEFEKEQENDIEEESANSWTFAAGSPYKSSPPKKIRSPDVSQPDNTPSKLKGPSHSQGKLFTKTGGIISPSVKPAKVFHNVRDDRTSIRPSSLTHVIGTENSKKAEPRLRSVQELAAQFDSPPPAIKDPADMTMSERKALFERKKDQASNGRFGTPQANRSVTPSRNTNMDNKKFRNMESGMKEQSHVFPSASSSGLGITRPSDVKKFDGLENRNMKKMSDESVSTSSGSNFVTSCQPQKSRILSATFATPTTSSNLDPAPSAIPCSSVEQSISKKSEEQQSNPADLYAGIHQVRPIRVSPPKPGKLYPCLSDIDSVTENESEPDENEEEDTPKSTDDRDTRANQDFDSSFTIDILGRAGLSNFINTPKRKLQEMQPDHQQMHTALGTSENDDSTDISDLLDEALDSPGQSASPKQQKRDGSDDVTLEDDGLAISLFHSVSSYRQQKEKTFTPIKQIVRKPEVRQIASHQESYHSNESNEMSIQQQIRSLQDEITTQQNVMAQACQALNLCRATAEFSGSTEQVEGEKLLLISSQKRQAAINEIQRLKSEAAMKVVSNNLASRGTLSLSNIGLPLKKEFLTMLPKGGGDIVHYFIVLIRSRGQVIPLQMLSTVDGIQDGVLRFPNLVQLSNLSADFDIAVEVYALQTRKEKMNHETKYHIRKENSKMRLTPKKFSSKTDNRGLAKTPTSAGSSGVNLRNSSFGLVGVANITSATLRRREWSLERVPLASPIDGTFQLRIQSHSESLIEERGFLTVFEDVGGFGAWHRRWCLLSNDQLLFWKYPDDEKLKEPQYSINLRRCITENVGVVSHDVCARPNTFLLITVRPKEDTDRDSLVMTCYPNETALRHLISADVKEERQLWCTQINRVLANLRVWNLE